MPTIFQKLAKILAHKEQEKREATVHSERTIIWQSGCEELGVAVADPIDESVALKIIESAPSNLDFRATIDLVKQRIGWATKAGRLSELQYAGVEADKALRQFVDDETERVRLAREKRLALNETSRLAAVAYQAAVTAESELLATAQDSPEEHELAAQLSEVSRAIDGCNASLSRFGDPSVSHTIRLNQLREQLRSAPQRDPKLRADIERQIKFRETAIEATTKQLASLNKQREEMQAKQKQLSAGRLQPERFRLIRRKPAASDQRQLGGAIG